MTEPKLTTHDIENALSQLWDKKNNPNSVVLPKETRDFIVATLDAYDRRRLWKPWTWIRLNKDYIRIREEYRAWTDGLQSKESSLLAYVHSWEGNKPLDESTASSENEPDLKEVESFFNRK